MSTLLAAYRPLLGALWDATQDPTTTADELTTIRGAAQAALWQLYAYYQTLFTEESRQNLQSLDAGAVAIFRPYLARCRSVPFRDSRLMRLQIRQALKFRRHHRVLAGRVLRDAQKNHSTFFMDRSTSILVMVEILRLRLLAQDHGIVPREESRRMLTIQLARRSNDTVRAAVLDLATYALCVNATPPRDIPDE